MKWRFEKLSPGRAEAIRRLYETDSLSHRDIAPSIRLYFFGTWLEWANYEENKVNPDVELRIQLTDEGRQAYEAYLSRCEATGEA